MMSWDVYGMIIERGEEAPRSCGCMTDEFKRRFGFNRRISFQDFRAFVLGRTAVTRFSMKGRTGAAVARAPRNRREMSYRAAKALRRGLSDLLVYIDAATFHALNGGAQQVERFVSAAQFVLPSDPSLSHACGLCHMTEHHLPRPAQETVHSLKEAIEQPSDYGFRQWSGWIIGPALLLITCFTAPPEGLSVEGWRTAGAASLMAVLWMTEAIPIPVTALLPLVLFPALHLSDVREAAVPYANPIIFLFLGGFIIALAMLRWNLHRRVAISLISRMGTQPNRIIGGFLLASAAISMWVSNTATTLMMLPIAISVMQLLPETSKRDPAIKAFGTALMLSVAFGATTGGMGTLIGTPPNALLAAYVDSVYGFKIGFGQWMLLGVPVVLVTLPVVYFVLTRISFRIRGGEVPGMAALLATERARLGPFGRGEAAVAVVFALTALGWVFQPLIARVMPLATDTTIALTGAIALFLIPISVRRGEFVMTWSATKNLPWEVLLLFGGGLSLAGNIERHGLSKYLGYLCSGLDGLPLILVVAIVCFGILMLTELTSNTATAATFLPIAASIGLSMGQNPLLFVIPTALAANCSYMLPVGTPPNAIVFGSGLIRLPEMAKAGMILNILLVPIVVGLLWLLGPRIFGIELGVVPPWAGK